MSKGITHDNIREANDDAALLEDNYLRQKGWKHTCESPGCYWVWEKTMPDDRVAIVSKSLALTFQRIWDEQQQERATEPLKN